MMTKQQCADKIGQTSYWRNQDGQIYRWDTINATYTLMRRVADHGGREIRVAHEEVVDVWDPLIDGISGCVTEGLNSLCSRCADQNDAEIRRPVYADSSPYVLCELCQVNIL